LRQLSASRLFLRPRRRSPRPCCSTRI
jgi:hypothetical protein